MAIQTVGIAAHRVISTISFLYIVNFFKRKTPVDHFQVRREKKVFQKKKGYRLDQMYPHELKFRSNKDDCFDHEHMQSDDESIIGHNSRPIGIPCNSGLLFHQQKKKSCQVYNISGV